MQVNHTGSKRTLEYNNEGRRNKKFEQCVPQFLFREIIPYNIFPLENNNCILANPSDMEIFWPQKSSNQNVNPSNCYIDIAHKIYRVLAHNLIGNNSLGIHSEQFTDLRKDLVYLNNKNCVFVSPLTIEKSNVLEINTLILLLSSMGEKPLTGLKKVIITKELRDSFKKLKMGLISVGQSFTFILNGIKFKVIIKEMYTPPSLYINSGKLTAKSIIHFIEEPNFPFILIDKPYIDHNIEYTFNISIKKLPLSRKKDSSLIVNIETLLRLLFKEKENFIFPLNTPLSFSCSTGEQFEISLISAVKNDSEQLEVDNELQIGNEVKGIDFYPEYKEGYNVSKYDSLKFISKTNQLIIVQQEQINIAKEIIIKITSFNKSISKSNNASQAIFLNYATILDQLKLNTYFVENQKLSLLADEGVELIVEVAQICKFKGEIYKNEDYPSKWMSECIKINNENLLPDLIYEVDSLKSFPLNYIEMSIAIPSNENSKIDKNKLQRNLSSYFLNNRFAEHQTFKHFIKNCDGNSVELSLKVERMEAFFSENLPVKFVGLTTQATDWVFVIESSLEDENDISQSAPQNLKTTPSELPSIKDFSEEAITSNKKMYEEETLLKEIEFEINNKSVTGRNLKIIDPVTKFEEFGIGGLSKEIKEMLTTLLITHLLKSEAFKRGITTNKGLLFYGPPGTGKTTLAKAIAKILDCKRVNEISGAALISKWVGATEENIVKLFALAKKAQERFKEKSPLFMIVIDEIDALLTNRDKNNSHKASVNAFLSEMEGLEKLNNLLVVGTTNRLDNIDAAVLRRFTAVEIGIPTNDSRKQIFELHKRPLIEKNLLFSDIDLTPYIKESEGFTGADVKKFFDMATFYSLSRLYKLGLGSEYTENDKAAQITKKDFDKAFKIFKEERAKKNGLTSNLNAQTYYS